MNIISVYVTNVMFPYIIVNLISALYYALNDIMHSELKCSKIYNHKQP